MGDLSTKILEMLEASPGQKAKQLAARLSVDRMEVNSALYGPLRGRVVQDKAFRWWLKSDRPKSSSAPEQELQDTELSRLSKYFLNCLSHDNQSGVQVFARGKFSLKYCELDVHPCVEGASQESLWSSSDAKRLLASVKNERNQLVLWLGYPVHLHRFRSRRGDYHWMVEPVFLHAIHLGGTGWVTPRLAEDEAPILNFKMLENVTGTKGAPLMDDTLQLMDDLGLVDPESAPPEVDELVARLRALRPDWDWKEVTDAFALQFAPALNELDETGIYNRAVLVVGERSPYTKGLEAELSNLQRMREEEYDTTALGAWIRGARLPASVPAENPLLEVLPLNSEQRQAVRQGLSNSLTVVTGPPGTGKSQVVTSLLVNCAWSGQRVLFASKNNKAVDVVEARVNGLGPRTMLLRLGAGQYQAQLAEYLASLLAAAADDQDRGRYKGFLAENERLGAEFAVLDELAERVVALRNRADALDQELTSSRQSLGDARFRKLTELDPESASATIARFSAALDRSDRTRRHLLLRIAWSLVRKRRLEALLDRTSGFRAVSSALGVEVPRQPPSEQTLEAWRSRATEVGSRLAHVPAAREYLELLAQLRSARPLEELALARAHLQEEVCENSERLWEAWLRLAPDRLSAAERTILAEYASVLKMLIESSQTGSSFNKGVYAKYKGLFPKVTSMLPCWAVTSLSAKGRLPLEAGFFDLLIIDEASQCDIASVLPLLFRAKRAVVIGDPMQLRHISTLSPHMDQQLLEKHDLLEKGKATWAYSTNSLFDLACSLTSSEDIVFLRDHHRSHSDIIEFSNRHFYGDRLRVATRYSQLYKPLQTGPAVRWIHIGGQARSAPGGGSLNEAEAKAVVTELQRVIFEQKYKGTIGIVSPFRGQTNLIRQLTAQVNGLLEAAAGRDLLIDTVHRFQGDERDLMIFSPVVTRGMSKGSLYFLSKTPNLFNVAITRARSTLLVIGDHGAATECEVDYLQRFSVYVKNLDQPGATTADGKSSHDDPGPRYPTVARPDRVSDWERLLYSELYRAGLRPIPQYDVEKYTLDFALFGHDRRLDIEVDGEQHHRAWDGELRIRDQLRNQRLIELGWDVMRFWVPQVRDDLNGVSTGSAAGTTDMEQLTQHMYLGRSC